MDAVVEFFRRLPREIARAGGSLPLRAGLLVLALALNVSFYLPSLPEGTPGVGVPGLDKLVHVAVFALTVLAAGRLLAPRSRFPMGWVVIAAIVHAGVIELVQLLLPARRGDGADLLADVVGIALGLGAWIWLRRRDRAATPPADAADGDADSRRLPVHDASR